MITFALFLILVLVMVLPFTFHAVERNIEVFLFLMGVAAAVVAGVMDHHLLVEALEHPLPITAAVLVMGFVFKWTRRHIAVGVGWLLQRVPMHLFVFALILVLGLLSSVITVIIASLVLVEVISLLKLERKAEVRIVILACFALGLGAALTPIGEPLATLAVAKLSGEPYHADFWFLLRHLGWWVVPGVLAFALLSLPFHNPKAADGEPTLDEAPDEVLQDESVRDVFVRAVKVFLFVMALVFLGEGFKSVVEEYILKMPALGLYWINILSAVLDNATLTAAEISPRMEPGQIRDILLGLLLAGGLLIPGNIPNIIAASKLKIGSKEWALFALPVGLAAMAITFVLLLLLPH
jgi:predicted cation transporter